MGGRGRGGGAEEPLAHCFRRSAINSSGVGVRCRLPRGNGSLSILTFLHPHPSLFYSYHFSLKAHPLTIKEKFFFILSLFHLWNPSKTNEFQFTFYPVLKKTKKQINTEGKSFRDRDVISYNFNRNSSNAKYRTWMFYRSNLKY